MTRPVATHNNVTATPLVPPAGWCNACWLHAHVACERRLLCACSVCHPGRAAHVKAEQS